MICKAEIEAGICGFHTTLCAQSEDVQHVAFEVETDCDKIRRLAVELSTLGPLDAFQEINPAKGSRLLETARTSMSGCCAGCAVPVGLFKAMQVAAALALPKDVHIGISSA
ncbi:MAG: hypothetical protein QHJ82_15705 [Verrucomicrobiota bacterium]|nr:hypothetical protein [Verrucomicrobiota bacterium]